jgi:ribosomal-protein-serine acetyltransferase
VANHKSNQVALRNGFTLEGCLKQAEYLNGAMTIRISTGDYR